jgi:predicted PhzF superfamily epimerase YddE/YHI9
MNNVHMLRVFTDPTGNYGDVASVIIDEGRHISDAERQALARKLNTGETAFINDVATADISIMHPQGEIDFAGVAALGTAWLLAKLSSQPITCMNGRGGEITVQQDGDITQVRANLTAMPPWHHKQLENVKAIERLTLKENEAIEHTMYWAWVDESRGLIRARTFASDWDIPEAEGNGSGAMTLAAMLDREIEIKHSKGSIIFARSTPGRCAEIGGRVMEES